MSILKNILNAVLNLLFTFRCLLCDKECNFHQFLCPDCKNNIANMLHKPKQVFDIRYKYRLFTMSNYTSNVGNIIKIIKYKPSQGLLKAFTELCLKQVPLTDFFSENDVLMSVPMHPKKKKLRGFNQAEYIAKAIAKKYNCKYSEPLKRSRHVKAQAECNEIERLSNLNNIFVIDSNVLYEDFKGKRIIIIDDVATTGTTINKCAEALEPLQLQEVIGLVITHSYKTTGR